MSEVVSRYHQENLRTIQISLNFRTLSTIMEARPLYITPNCDYQGVAKNIFYEGGTVGCGARFLALFWCGFAVFGENIHSDLRGAVFGKNSGKIQCGFWQNYRRFCVF